MYMIRNKICLNKLSYINCVYMFMFQSDIYLPLTSRTLYSNQFVILNISSPFFSFDKAEQPLDLNNGKFQFTIHCVPLV